MERRGMQGMWGRYILFVVLSLAIFLVNILINPPKPEQPKPDAAKLPKAEQPEAPPEVPPPSAKPAEELTDKKAAADKEANKPAEKPAVAPQPEIDPEWVTLGSAAPAGPFRMLATLSNVGASLVRVEMSSENFRDLEDRSGYLGHIVGDPMAGGDGGCPVQMVGVGTPAALAGLKKGDLIVGLDGKKVSGALSLQRLLRDTRPGQTIQLTVVRDDNDLDLPVTLQWRPLEVMRPEGTDPLSFLLTLAEVDDKRLQDVVEAARQEAKDVVNDEEDKDKNAIRERDPTLGLEIDGVDLRNGAWEIVQHNQTEAVFRRLVPEWDLELLKTYRLAEVPQSEIADANFKAYHLTLDVAIRNVGEESHKVAYQLDGPTGLPIEGYWYANKIGRRWGAVGLRDVVVRFQGSAEPDLIPCPKIADDKVGPPWQDQSLDYIGVDAQYFSAVMMPLKMNPEEIWFATSQPIRVGPVDPKWVKTTNTSFRVTSRAQELEPGKSRSDSFLVFAGPKKPDLLAQYDLDGLVYYGWFGVVAKPMLSILHMFYAIVGNYGIAIIMLTILVRLFMFPMSRKQALNAQKMAELQPEIKKIHEKYKKDFDARNKAQQELFRKHNYSPLSGCLVMFVQLPIFLGLYRGLMVDIELRQAPLISRAVAWCSNLAAPDMLFNWEGFMPAFITNSPSMFGLGPYFNLLPIITILLFILQQKILMPPPADEQAAMQQNVMKFMMVFMGIVFFKVASGLCIYFIASSAWSLAERKFLPKKNAPADSSDEAKPKPKPKNRPARGKR